MYQELTLLADWKYSAASNILQNAGSEWRPRASDGGANLDAHERAEVVYAEIIPPTTYDDTTGAVTFDQIRSIHFVLDSKEIPNYVRLPGSHDALINPMPNRAHNGSIVAFGQGIEAAINNPSRGMPILSNTTLKYAEDIRPVVRAGTGGVKTDFRIRLWGYRYDSRMFATLLSQQRLTGSFELRDRFRNRSKPVTKVDIPITGDTWTQLPGGPDQSMPKIMPFIRFARNAQASTRNEAYVPRFETGHVAESEENLFFDFIRNPHALIINGFGLRRPLGATGAWNVRDAWIEVEGDPNHQKHPKGGIQITEEINPLHFGAAEPVQIGEPWKYYAIPKFAGGKPLAVWNDRVYPTFRDNGQATVAANDVIMVINGVLIEMEG